MAEPKTFEIGLVMAGAVSAGAYTAGVLDFLLEALERWEAEKAAQHAQHGTNYDAWTVPPHSVRIEVVAGASAGSICAGLLTASLGNPPSHVHVSGDAPPNEAEVAGNLLYRSWVRDIDISWLLDTSDINALAADESLASLLNCDRIDDVAEDVAAAGKTATATLPPHIADAMPVVLSLGNLRGIPYGIGFSGGAGTSHGMSRHADIVRYDLAVNGAAHASAVQLVPGDAQSNAWDGFANAALASAAFPVALKPRIVATEHARINARPWVTVKFDPAAPPGQFNYVTEEVPSRLQDGAGPHEFVTVDGGLLDNEPFEIARQLLAGPDYRNPREKDTAKRAVLMVDPFPNDDSYDMGYDAAAETGMLKVVLGMFSALMNNARFKADTLRLVGSGTSSYSRFVISPSGALSPNPPPAKPVDIACGALGGFSGFFSQEFRHHDFVLGRRNCQRFLAEHFVLAEDNPVFGDAAAGAWRADPRWRRTDLADGGLMHAVLPLMDGLYADQNTTADAILPASWPKLSDGDWTNIAGALDYRMIRVAMRLAKEHVGGVWGWLIGIGFWIFGGGARDKVVQEIDERLVAAGLKDP